MKKIKGGVITTIFLVSLIVTINPVSAADWHVYPGSGTPIQTAITNAPSGDTIYVHAGMYNENLSITKNLSLIGDGASVTTINGGGSTVIEVNGTTVNISGFTITDDGDGLYYCNGSSGTIENNTITGNDEKGIENYYSDPTIRGNTITENSWEGIDNDYSNPIITNNVIADNNYGIFNNDSNSTITNNTIEDNKDKGIYNYYSDPTINGNTIKGNEKGGIYNHYSDSNMTNNTITGNEREGIENDYSNVSITNNTIAGNGWEGIDNGNSNGTIINNVIADNDYGIFNGYSDFTITNNTITRNHLEGIYNHGSSTEITNNIITSNGDYGIYDVAGSTSTNTYNDVWGNTPGNYGGTASAGTGSISQNPMFVGGGNYRLLCGSPAVDSGTDAGVYIDIEGNTRPSGSGFDMGAYEGCISIPQVNPIAAFIPVKNYHLRQVNTCLGCIMENLPEDVPDNLQALLDEMQEHIDNANTTGNTIYANNELLKALDLCEEIQEILSIMCT